MTTFGMVHNVSRNWPWVLALGVLQVIMGVAALIFAGFTSLAAVLYLGIVLMVTGVAEIVYSVKTRESGDMWFHLLFGGLTAVCGYFIAANPLQNLVVLTVLLSALFIGGGLATFIGSLVERFHNWGWFALQGVVSTIVGLYILRSPFESSLWLIGSLVGLNLIIRGISWMGVGSFGRNVNKMAHA